MDAGINNFSSFSAWKKPSGVVRLGCEPAQTISVSQKTKLKKWKEVSGLYDRLPVKDHCMSGFVSTRKVDILVL